MPFLHPVSSLGDTIPLSSSLDLTIFRLYKTLALSVLMMLDLVPFSPHWHLPISLALVTFFVVVPVIKYPRK